MQKLFAGKIFADHYQFYLFDKNSNWYEEMPDWTDDDYARKRYISNGRTIYIGTEAHLNCHWVGVYLSDRAPNLSNCERALGLNLEIQAGELILSTTLEDVAAISVKPGKYIAYVLAFNLGEEERGSLLSDEELSQRSDLERYMVILVPGALEEQGVLKGEEYAY